FRLAQAKARAALVAAGPDVEFVAVPGTDDVGLGAVVFQRARGAVVGDRLDHALHDAALADRPGAMGAAIVPREKFAIEPEDADLELAAFDDLAVAIGVVGDFAREIFRHMALPASVRCVDASRRLPIVAVNRLGRDVKTLDGCVYFQLLSNEVWKP